MKKITALLAGLMITGATFGQCSFDGQYEQKGPMGHREVMLIQGNLIIGASYAPDGQLTGMVRPHRITNSDCQQRSFVASTLTLDDDSALKFVGAPPMYFPPTQTYRMEGNALNVPGRGLFFTAVWVQAETHAPNADATKALSGK